MQDLFYTNKFKKKSNFLLSNLEMSQIDKMAANDGIPSIKLMENAGKRDVTPAIERGGKSPNLSRKTRKEAVAYGETKGGEHPHIV